MQLGEIRDNHSSDMHQVTKCLHDHGQLDKNMGKMAMSPSAAAQQMMQTNKQQQSQLTLNDWIHGLLESGKQRLSGFWNGSDVPSSKDESQKAGSDRMAAQVGSGSDKHVTNTSNPQKDTTIHSNPYFAAVPVSQSQNTAAILIQKVKQKYSSITEQLAKHLPGNFSKFQKNGSFRAKKDGNQEDLRHRSKYREDKLEIDCILTDESYLLDSYDRNGEYSQLTTTK